MRVFDHRKLLLDRVRPAKVYESVDWPLLVMFAGLFVVVHAFEATVVRTWGIENFRGLPENPRTPYYRAGDQILSGSERLYEFVVPMVPLTWNKQDRVREYRDQFRTGAQPVAADIEQLDTDALAGLLTGHHAVVFSAGAGGGDPKRTYAVDRDAAIRAIDAATPGAIPTCILCSARPSRASYWT